MSISENHEVLKPVNHQVAVETQITDRRVNPVVVIGGIAAGAAVVFSLGYGFKTLVIDNSPEGHRAALSDASTLREQSACRDELQAIADAFTYRATLPGNADRIADDKQQALEYAAAANLADKYDVACEPANGKNKDVLSGDFSVEGIRERGDCADELWARVDPEAANYVNSARRNSELVANFVLTRQADLAALHNIGC